MAIDKNAQKEEPTGPAPAKKAKKGSPLPAIIILVIIVLAVVYFALGYLNSAQTVTITGTTALTISAAPQIMVLNGTSYMISLDSYNATEKTAHVYLNALPPFINPEYNITLVQGVPVRVNAGTSDYATMLIVLSNASSGSAKVDISQIPLELQERPNSTYIALVNTSLSAYGQPPSKAANKTTTSIATTAPATTTKTTTVATTTTINQSANETQEVIAALEKGLYYPIMLNYSKVYANSVNCTPTLYNAVYKSYYNKTASGVSDYANSSAITPYALNYTVSNYASGYSTVTYSTTSHSAATTGVALTVNISRSSGLIVAEQLPLNGVYGGSNATQLNSGLKKIALIGGACGVDVFSAA